LGIIHFVNYRLRCFAALHYFMPLLHATILPHGSSKFRFEPAHTKSLCAYFFCFPVYALSEYEHGEF
jgi:hypothetical protein